MKSLRLLAAGALALASFAASPVTAMAGTIGGVGDGNGDGRADLVETVQDGRYITAPQANGLTWFRPGRPGKTPLANPKADAPTLFTDWTKTIRVNVGLGAATDMQALPDMTGDKKADYLVRFGSHLYFYKNRGDGIPVRAYEIGHDWSAMNFVIYGGHLNADAGQYLLARRASDGALFAYKLVAGGVRSIGQVPSGWAGFRTILGPGQVLGDAKADLVAVDAKGVLWCYRGLGNGKFAARVACGSGYNAYKKVFSPGDLDGDGRNDLAVYKAPTKATWSGEPDLKAYGVTSLDQLLYKDRGPVYMFPNRGNGTFGSKIMVSYDDFQFFLFA